MMGCGSSSHTVDDDALWPLIKLKQAHRRIRNIAKPNTPMAVLLSTGAMNPVHKGHVQMLHQARERLEREGYAVIGAWLSPSHDGYVQPKAANLRTPGLTAAFRLELARRAVEDDDLVAVGSWEARQKGRWPDFPVVAAALLKELKSHPEGKGVTVFYVCGTDHFRKCGLHLGMRGGIGVVAVPRAAAGDEKKTTHVSGHERPDKLVFVAAPASGNIASCSSTKVREMLKAGDLESLSEAISEGASNLLLRPSQDELHAFNAEYKQLGLLEIVETLSSNASDLKSSIAV